MSKAEAAQNSIKIVPVAHRVHAIAGYSRKPQGARRHLHIDGEGGPGQGGAAQGKHVGAVIALGHALFVPQEHFGIGHEVVREQDGLGVLEVGVAGHDDTKVLFGQIGQGADGLKEEPAAIQEHIPKIKPGVQSDLIVTAAGGVELASHLADLLHEPLFHGHVNVFLGGVQGQFAPFDFTQDFP